MKTLSNISVFSLLLFCVSMPAVSDTLTNLSQDEFQIHCTGHLHGHESYAQDGETWMALITTDDGAELRLIKISVEPVRDFIMGDEEDVKTGRNVSVPGIEETILLLRPTDAFQTGPVKVMYKGRMKSLQPGYKQVWAWNNDEIWILATGNIQLAKKDYVRMRVEDYHLQIALERYKSNEVLFQSILEGEAVDPDSSPYLIWAGDLDGDEKPDFIFDLTNHFNVSHYALFLSSQAGEGQLVKRVADFRTTGC